MAILYLQEGKQIEAETYFKLAMDPEHQAALVKLAEDYIAKGDFVKATEFYELANDHGQRSSQITLGDTHKKNWKYERRHEILSTCGGSRL